MKLRIPVRVAIGVASFFLGSFASSQTQTNGVERSRSGNRQGGPVAGVINIPPAIADQVLLRYKVDAARKYFESTWTEFFKQRRAPYSSPPLIAYQQPIRTSCGEISLGNAAYCPSANAIYYDEAFLIGLMKRVGAETGGDGDYAPITVLAHEWGHAVQRWLEQSASSAFRQQYVFFQEQEADCFAGSVTRMAEKSGYLEAGDLEEARHVLAIGGDKGFLGLAGHGNPTYRIESFNRGYEKGVTSCDVGLDPDSWHHAVEDWRKAWRNRSFNDMLKDPNPA